MIHSNLVSLLLLFSLSNRSFLVDDGGFLFFFCEAFLASQETFGSLSSSSSDSRPGESDLERKEYEFLQIAIDFLCKQTDSNPFYDLDSDWLMTPNSNKGTNISLFPITEYFHTPQASTE